jgi:hypothetical protein
MREHEMWRHTLEQLSRQTRGAHKYSAPGGRDKWTLYGGAYHLWVLSAERGSCHSPGTWNFKVAATFTENLRTSGVLLAKGLLSWKFWLHFWATRLHDMYFFVCITVSIPSGAHAGWNANSMLRNLCLYRYKRLHALYISLLNYKVIISNSTQQVPSWEAASFWGSQFLQIQYPGSCWWSWR